MRNKSGVTECDNEWEIEGGEIKLLVYDLNFNEMSITLTSYDLEAMIKAMREEANIF